MLGGSRSSHLLSLYYPYHPCMVRIFTYMYRKNQPNVGKYTIQGWYGLWTWWPCLLLPKYWQTSFTLSQVLKSFMWKVPFLLEKFKQLKLPLKENYFLIQFGCISKKTSAPESLETMTENQKTNVNFPTNKHQTSTTPPEKNGLKKNTWEDPNPFYTQKTFNHVEPTNIFVWRWCSCSICWFFMIPAVKTILVKKGHLCDKWRFP